MGKAAFTPVAQAYRFYNDDGTEATSTPKAAESTNVNITNDSNARFHLRWLVQETGGADGATTDDFGLQYQVNGTGSWTAVTDATSRVRAYPSSQLTDGGTTTNRATNGIADGTGSFVAGEQEEVNGVIEDRQLTTSNFTEHVWALELVAADNSLNDTLGFRMTLNAGNPGMTSSTTPTVTIKKTVTVALTTVLGTGSVGSFGKTIQRALTTVLGTGAVGSVSFTIAYSKAITGNLATGEVGNLGKQLVLAITGNAGTGAVGTVSPGRLIPITGVTGTGSVGDLAKSIAVVLSTVLGTGGVGNLGKSVTLALTGVGSIGAVGLFAPQISVAITGLEGTGAVGTLTPTLGGFSVAITGNVALGDVGTLSIAGSTVITFAGVSSSGGSTQHTGISKPTIILSDVGGGLYNVTIQYGPYDFKSDSVGRETYTIDGELP